MRSCTAAFDELTAKMLSRAQYEGWYRDGMGLHTVVLSRSQLVAMCK